MAWNQSATNSKNQNEESKILKKPGCKRPKCVSFAFWWFIVLGIIIPACKIDHLLSSIYPWTDFAGACVVGLLMIYCAGMISKRNMTAVFISGLTLFFSGWILGTVIAAAICIMPMIFLVLPHSIRWLRLHNRFSVPSLIASALMVFFSGVIYFAPSVTHSVISNVNPLSVIVPGDKAPHLIGEAYSWQTCWMHGRMIGSFHARYNKDGECCYVRLDIVDEPFWKNVVGICNERFGNRISWSKAVTAKSLVTEAGHPMLRGIVDEKIIMILPRGEDSDCGSLLICDVQLYSEEGDEDSEHAKTRSIYNNPLIHDYGNPDRRKLFSQPFRNGLGMY